MTRIIFLQHGSATIASMVLDQQRSHQLFDELHKRRTFIAGHVAVVCGSDLLASALALQFRAQGYAVVMCDRVDPPAIWRGMTFTDAWYVGRSTLGDKTACFCASLRSVRPLLDRGYIVATTWSSRAVADALQATWVVDARSEADPMTMDPLSDPLVPVEGGRSGLRIQLSRALTTLSPYATSFDGWQDVRAASEGRFVTPRHIGEHVRKGNWLGQFNGESVDAPCDGVVLGLAARGAMIAAGAPVAAVDPHDNPLRCFGPDAAALAIAKRVIASLCRQAVVPA